MKIPFFAHISSYQKDTIFLRCQKKLVSTSYLTMKIVPITLFFLPFVQGTNAAADEQQQQHLRGLGEGGGSGDGGGDDPCGFKGTWLGEGICSINFLNREEIGHGCGRNRKLKLYPNDDGTLEAFSQVRRLFVCCVATT